MTGTTVIDGLDYGPLACLVGTWAGDKGMDVAPEPEGPVSSPYYETILFEACGDVDNAGVQDLVIVRYHQVVHRKSTGKVFHNESGYYCWDASRSLVMQSFTIPRGVALVAGGTGEVTADGGRIQVAAGMDDPDWTVAQAPFMRDNAATRSFSHQVEVTGDTMRYSETTVVRIYGKDFDHTDHNILRRG